MISISKKNVSNITKISLIVFVVWFTGFVAYKVIDYYRNSFKKERLELELKVKKQETTNLKRQITIVKNRMKQTEKQYIKKDEIEVKIKDIFKRMSVLDYDLKYLDAKKMCIDRHVLITQLIAPNEKSKKAGEAVLSYIGEIKKSDKSETIYFIDYISKPKGE